ncbi:MAG: leucine-rich repeat domain-containing protein [bacterium]
MKILKFFLLFLCISTLNNQLFGDIKQNQIKQIITEINKFLPKEKALDQQKIINDNFLFLENCNITDKTLSFLFPYLLKINKLYPIKILNLSYNKLTNIPDKIEKLSQLETLDFEHNNLGFISPKIKNLENLNFLFLDNNESIIYLPYDLKSQKDLKITGYYDFEIEKATKKAANIVIILDRENQIPPEQIQQDVMLDEMDINLKNLSPILVSGAVLKNFLERDKIIPGRKIIPQIYAFYKIDDSDLYLLLPKGINFKEAFNIDARQKKDLEYLKERLEENQWPNDKGDYETDNWLEGIIKIFKKDSDYWWNIILAGHGAPEEFIAGMTKNDFKSLMQFLNQPNINTFFFYYDTCFGGGTNLVEAYEIIKQSIIDVPLLKFMVVSGTTRSVVSQVVDTNYFDLFLNLNELLNFFQLPPEEQKNLGPDPINGLLKLVKNKIGKYILSSNFPLIKFPNSKFFISIRKNPRVFVINNVLLKKHQIEKKEIEIPKDVNILFVYPNIVDVPVKITGKKSPLIYSLDPGPTIHFFKEIVVENVKQFDPFDLIIDYFKEEEEGKIFIVKEIISKDMTYKNVVTDPEKEDIFYKKNNFFYYNNYKIEEKNKMNENKFKKEITKAIENNFKISMELFKPFAPWQTDRKELVDYINKELGINVKITN